MTKQSKIKKDDIRLQLAEAQDFTCPLSKVKFILVEGRVIDPTTKKAVSVDHDHETGFVRGVLIQKVNWLVDQWQQGSYGELTQPQEITDYLKDYPARAALGNVLYEDIR